MCVLFRFIKSILGNCYDPRVSSVASEPRGWRRGAVYLFPWLGVLSRRILAVPATSAVPERLFSTASDVMKLLTCDKMKDSSVYLHEVWE